MKPNILLIFLCVLATTLLTAQTENNKILRGKVLFQNSNFTPAESVEVSGVIKVEKEEYANKVNTDSKGQYELKFPLARKGHPVKLTIGKNDKTGQELEVVNEKELQLCRIPANANQEFEIIVCPKGSRDLAARKYYRILKNSKELAYEQIQEQFRELTEAQDKDYKTIHEVADDLTKLQTQLNDSIALYKEAKAIASINKDGVNERVINYLKLLDDGKSVQEARKELSISKASNDMEKGITLFRAGVKELEERARASAAVFDYKDAVICYDTLIAKAEKLNLDRLELSEYYLIEGEYSRYAGDYQISLESNQKVVAIREMLLDSLNLSLASAYNNMGMAYNNLGDFKSALKYHKNALKIRSIVLDSLDLALGISYGNMAISMRNLKRPKKALSYQIKAMELFKRKLDSTHPDYVTALSNLGVLHEDLGAFDIALNIHKKVLKIKEQTLDSLNPSLLFSYANMSQISIYARDFKMAEIYKNKALKLLTKTDNSLHPFRAEVYYMLSTIESVFGNHKKAMLYNRMASRIFKYVFGEKHLKFLLCKYLQIVYLYKLNEREKYLEMIKEMLPLIEDGSKILHTDFIFLYVLLAMDYSVNKQLEKSLKYSSKAHLYAIKHWPENLPYFIILKKVHSRNLYLKSTKYFRNSEYKNVTILLDQLIEIETKNEYLQMLVESYFYLGEFSKTIKALKKQRQFNKGLVSNEWHFYLGLAYAKNHQFPEAKEAFTAYQKLFPKQGRPYRNWAMYYALQNQKEEALENLEKAVALGFKDLHWLQTDDSMKKLRNEPRFKALLEKLKE